MKYVIFGAGGIGKRKAQQISKQGNEIVAFWDNDTQKQGTIVENIPVASPNKLTDLEYDRIFVASLFSEEMENQLLEMGIDSAIIDAHEEIPITTRKQWLTDLAAIFKERGIQGNVAEAGVFRGDFAKHINSVFPDKTLYLFDTFEGFPKSDIDKEELPSAAKPGNYGFTSVDVVINKLPYPEKAVIRKGYFPQTAEGIDDTFCFVNLDLDLYQPTLEGLKFFYGKLSQGGVVLIHDFFGVDFPNVRTAVYDFERQLGELLKLMPIGDTLSIAIVK